MNKNMRLSKSFRLGEFLHSQTAERDQSIYREQNNPPEEVISNLVHLCQKTLQPIRDKLNVPMRISSGYRCESLNQKIGGSQTSQHILGQAADCIINDKYLTDRRFRDVMAVIRRRVERDFGVNLSHEININYYLFIYIVMKIDALDIDQVVHEYGEDKGKPGWIHVASSPAKIYKRRITAIGNYLPGKKEELSLVSAIAYGALSEEVV